MGIVTLVAAAAEVSGGASSVPVVDAEVDMWLRVGEGVGDTPGESRLQIWNSSRRPAVEDEYWLSADTVTGESEGDMPPIPPPALTMLTLTPPTMPILSIRLHPPRSKVAYGDGAYGVGDRALRPAR